MKIESEKAKIIEEYLKNRDPEGNWPLLYEGKKDIKPYYRFPIEFLRYNPSNGRLASEVIEWEKKNGDIKINPSLKEHSNFLKNSLLDLDKNKTDELLIDIKNVGQMEPGIITHDGVVINGNRRMAILEVLSEKNPGGDYKHLTAVRLPDTIAQKDLWIIEAGLQLSKDKVAPYTPVNELLKIKQGRQAHLSIPDIAAALYGRDEDDVISGLERLSYIEEFLKFFGDPGNYGLITARGLHEYFINMQNGLKSVSDKTEKLDRIHSYFHLICAHIESINKGEKGLRGHTAIRDMKKVLDHPKAYVEFNSFIVEKNKPNKDDYNEIIDGFKSAKEIIEFEKEKNKPITLISRAIKALESIDADSDHFKIPQVSSLLNDLQKELTNLKKSHKNK